MPSHRKIQGSCVDFPNCRLRRLFDEVDELVRCTFESISLETLVRGPMLRAATGDLFPAGGLAIGFGKSPAVTEHENDWLRVLLERWSRSRRRFVSQSLRLGELPLRLCLPIGCSERQRQVVVSERVIGVELEGPSEGSDGFFEVVGRTQPEPEAMMNLRIVWIES